MPGNKPPYIPQLDGAFDDEEGEEAEPPAKRWVVWGGWKYWERALNLGLFPSVQGRRAVDPRRPSKQRR